MDPIKRQQPQASMQPHPFKNAVIPAPHHVRRFAAASASNRKTGKKHPGKAILAGK